MSRKPPPSRVPPHADTALVYSTERGGSTCPACRRALPDCVCAARADAQALADLARNGGTVRVSRQTAGRGGKAVTLVRDVPLPAAELAALAQALRSACGAGGTLKDRVIEVQGDHVERLVALLAQRGLRVRKAS